MLLTVQAANDLIRTGAPLCIAGSRDALGALDSGNWIGGSIPYFMTESGGVCDRRQVFVEKIGLPWSAFRIATYDCATLSQIAADGFANGFTYVIIPAGSEAHLQYAMKAPEFPDMFIKPVIGWIAGMHLDDLARDHAAVFDGRMSAAIRNGAVALHVELPEHHQAVVKTINPFRPGTGPAIRFAKTSFEATTATVDGRAVNLAAWLARHRLDASAPLVADYAGMPVNVSIKAIDAAAGTVSFYAPVFPDVDYHVAAPLPDYGTAYEQLLPTGARPIVSCNCILNYVYTGLEGKPTRGFVGPITFGEIAYQLLNQTLVYLECERSAA